MIGVVMTISGGVLFVTFAPEPPPDKVSLSAAASNSLMPALHTHGRTRRRG